MQNDKLKCKNDRNVIQERAFPLLALKVFCTNLETSQIYNYKRLYLTP